MMDDRYILKQLCVGKEELEVKWNVTVHLQTITQQFLGSFYVTDDCACTFRNIYVFPDVLLTNGPR